MLVHQRVIWASIGGFVGEHLKTRNRPELTCCNPQKIVSPPAIGGVLPTRQLVNICYVHPTHGLEI